MEFDKSRVYCVLNADKLKIGSECFFASSLVDLKKMVIKGVGTQRLTKVKSKLVERCFIGEYGDYPYIYAYLVKPPFAPKYKPFESLESFADAVKKHGEYIRKSTGDTMTHIIGMGVSGDIIVNGACGLIYYYTPKNFLNLYVFANDGSPCGELMEE